MSDFGDFNTGSEDPTADFLARERAVLGEDADIFTSSNDANLLGDDEQISTPIAAVTNSLPSSPAIFNSSNLSTPNLQGHESSLSMYSNHSNNEKYSFDASYPEPENLETSQAFHKAMLPEEEPETVRLWREKQKETIANRDAISEKKKDEIIKKAREDIDKFYEEYNDKKQKAIEENREHEETIQKSRDETSSSSNVWERVSREVDISNAKTGYHTQDVTRMKELMLDLKKDTKAPGNIVTA